MKIEYKNNLYIKYLKQRLMYLWGWVVENKTYNGQSWYKEGIKDDLKNFNNINDIDVLERMLFDIKQFIN